MAMGEFSVYSSLQARSSLQLGLRVGGHLALTGFGPEEPQWTLAYGWHRRWQHYKYRRGYYYYYYYYAQKCAHWHTHTNTGSERERERERERMTGWALNQYEPCFFRVAQLQHCIHELSLQPTTRTHQQMQMLNHVHCISNNNIVLTNLNKSYCTVDQLGLQISEILDHSLTKISCWCVTTNKRKLMVNWLSNIWIC